MRTGIFNGIPTVAKRDVTTITTLAYNIANYNEYALAVINTLDQAVNVVCEYSKDNTNFTQIGSAISVPANTGGKAYGMNDVEGFKLVSGYLRFKATPAAVPTTGNLTVDFQVFTNI